MKYKFMKKIVIIGSLIFIVISIYCLIFTYAGQKLIYDTFGGKNLHLISGEKELFWFDSWHSNNPNDPMFKRIEEKFEKFKPNLVLVEGSSDIFIGSRDESILTGESSFTAYIAKQNNVIVKDIEPPFSDQIAFLQTKYIPESILAMYHIRQIGSIQKKPIDFNFNDYLINETQYFIDNGLNISINTLDEILNIVNSYLPININSETWKNENSVFETYNNFFKGKGVLAPIYKDIYFFRNVYLVELIKEKQIEYNKIFIVMGGQHLIDTRDQLKSIY